MTLKSFHHRKRALIGTQKLHGFEIVTHFPIRLLANLAILIHSSRETQSGKFVISELAYFAMHFDHYSPFILGNSTSPPGTASG
jgi:hypothetical protein